MDKLLGVVGFPILHSKSPEIFSHNMITQKYLRISTKNTEEISLLFEELEICGLNVTSPLKYEITDLLDHNNSPIEAVNTVVKNEIVCGYNTDIYGISQSLKPYQQDLKKAEIAILGAGGAAKAVAYVISKFTKNITIYNRTLSKARLSFPQYKIANLSTIAEQLSKFDFLISTLPNSYDLKDIKSKQNLIIFDANYHYTSLENFAKENDLRFISGKNWLLHQAEKAAELFTRKKRSFTLPDLKQKKSNIISLIGFMGAGKSSIGRKLANLLKVDYVDIDSMIEDFAQAKISVIINTLGEEYFRNLESTFLEQVLKTNKSVVCSCGGGIVEREYNRKLLKNASLNVWIYSSLKNLPNRIDTENRPKFDKNYKKLFHNRVNDYAELADLMIINDFKSVDETVEQLYEEISKSTLFA